MTRAVIGIDAGGTKIAAGLVAEGGELLSHVKRPTPRADREAVLTALCDAVAEVMAGAGSSVVEGIGAGIAGLVDTTAGRFVYGPNFPLADTPVAEVLGKRFGLPAVVDNDANVAAWAEYLYGAGERCGHMVLVTLGTGIGGGVVVDGHLLRGAHGFAAEFGHMTTALSGGLPCTCGKRGCWETVASGRALDHSAEILLSSPAGAGLEPFRQEGRSSGEVLGAAAEAGEPVAVEALDSFADLVAVGLQSLVQCFDPSRLVVGGGVCAMGDTLLEPVRRHFRARLSGAAHRPDVPVVAARLGPLSGVVGAAALLLEHG